MSKKKKKRNIQKREDANTGKQSFVGWLTSDDAWKTLCVQGYTRLDQIPAIVAGCRRIAELVGSMTIQLMENTKDGDVRIRNELSKKIDIDPCHTMNRQAWIEFIVMQMLLYGKGNAIVRVQTKNGLLENLQPIPSDRFNLIQDATGYDYQIKIDGVPYSRDEVLHFSYNPNKNYPWKGQGITTTLQELGNVLRQAQATEKAFFENPKPSMIVKVDAMTDQFQTKEGRKKVADEYIDQSEMGRPWIIPAEQLEIQQIKPLSLQDIALNQSVELDTKTVASLLGVPAFVLGVGTYNKDEWNMFINSKIKHIATIIQQELTRGLIINPKWYLKLNSWSLYQYDLQTVATVMTSLHDRGIVDGNEVRDKIDMSPREGLNELKVLENFIPVDSIGLQKKLKDGE